jgi:hypothetical protein
LVVLIPLSAALMWFGAVSGESVDPSARAQVLDVDFETTRLVQAFVPLPLATLWLLFATWRWHWAARAPVVRGDPPYR